MLQIHILVFQYFPDLTEKWVVDKKSQAQLGDIVTINPLSKKLTPEIKDEVHSIVFNQGAVIDPITGRMCRGTNFIDEKQREEEKLRRDTVDLTVTTTKYVDKVKKS